MKKLNLKDFTRKIKKGNILTKQNLQRIQGATTSPKRSGYGIAEAKKM